MYAVPILYVCNKQLFNNSFPEGNFHRVNYKQNVFCLKLTDCSQQKKTLPIVIARSLSLGDMPLVYQRATYCCAFN